MKPNRFRTYCIPFRQTTEFFLPNGLSLHLMLERKQNKKILWHVFPLMPSYLTGTDRTAFSLTRGPVHKSTHLLILSVRCTVPFFTILTRMSKPSGWWQARAFPFQCGTRKRPRGDSRSAQSAPFPSPAIDALANCQHGESSSECSDLCICSFKYTSYK